MRVFHQNESLAPSSLELWRKERARLQLSFWWKTLILIGHYGSTGFSLFTSLSTLFRISRSNLSVVGHFPIWLPYISEMVVKWRDIGKILSLLRNRIFSPKTTSTISMSSWENLGSFMYLARYWRSRPKDFSSRPPIAVLSPFRLRDWENVFWLFVCLYQNCNAGQTTTRIMVSKSKYWISEKIRVYQYPFLQSQYSHFFSYAL